jgi:predicted RNA polymerase sigma factor
MLLPHDPDVAGLLALILLTDARRHTRLDRTGRMLLLADQDRSQWDAAEITEGLAMVREATAHRPPSRYALQAAIAAVHAGAASWEATDWDEVVSLYDRLCEIWPSPVVALNRAVAIGLARGPDAGLRAIDEIGEPPELTGYRYLPAARADFLRQAGRTAEARAQYLAAIALTGNAVERAFLTDQMNRLTP